MNRQLAQLEKLAISMERRPWDAIYRIGIGVGLHELYILFFGAKGPLLAQPLLLMGILGLLRLGPAVLRRLLPFSIDARSIWVMRRRLAKRYDSYQWRKLFWIGLGLAFDTILPGRYQIDSMVLAMACMTSGISGLFIWHHRRMTARTMGPLSRIEGLTSAPSTELE